MARKLGYFLIVLNLLMAGYLFYFRTLSEIDPIPEQSEVYPERIKIIKGIELDSKEVLSSEESDSAI
ncbi:MAG: hypothetical protein O3B03_00225 [Proteobacteria bacterium]|nr:hypothetical protein [Pseudomonadota bacterium]MDA1331114.1 hypothetical protein [Pseudomonadota bacterium]